jgi:hypothetical protein
MNADQIIRTCRDLATQQFPTEPLERAHYEVELLSTKVMELSKELDRTQLQLAEVRERSEEYGAH